MSGIPPPPPPPPPDNYRKRLEVSNDTSRPTFDNIPVVAETSIVQVEEERAMDVQNGTNIPEIKIEEKVEPVSEDLKYLKKSELWNIDADEKVRRRNYFN